MTETVQFFHRGNEQQLTVLDCKTNCDEATFSIALYPKLTTEALYWIKENVLANDLTMNVPIRTIQFDYTKSNVLVKLALWLEETQLLLIESKKVKTIDIIFARKEDAQAFRAFFGLKKEENPD
jgi:hypothetical protein